jgi:signal peptidase I
MWGSSKVTEKHFYERGFEMNGRRERRRRRRLSKKGGGFLELLIVLIIAVALVFGFVRPFVVQSFWIPSESMVPTLEVGDRVFVNKFVYRFSEPERGDIVVFRSTEGGDDDLIKRVIGLPGDHVALYDGDVYVNFKRLEEPYIKEPHAGVESPNGSLDAATVPEGKVIVMGDNRANSRDSRFFGAVPLDSIEGEAFAIFWPPSHIGLL